MREEDLTLGLKCLSRAAHARGFRQEAKRGDWYLNKDGAVILCNFSEGTLRGFNPEEDALILEIGHCIAWLEGEGWELRSIAKGVHPSEGQYCITVREAAALTYEKGNARAAFGPTLDEAGAYLVNKIMEGKE
jgi:hypothetical protein